MWQTIQQQLSEFWHATPGTRFQRCYWQWLGSMQSWKKALLVGLGLVLIAVGLALSLIPGVPGFLFTLPGLGLLATQSHTLARWLDRAELALRQLAQRVREKV